MAERNLYALLDLAARDLDLPEYGRIAGAQSRLEDLGEIGHTLRQSLTLHDAITLFVRTVNEVSTGARFWVVREGAMAWLCRGGIENIEVGESQAELFVLSLLVQIVQLVDPAWTPDTICCKAGQLPGWVGRADICFSQSCTAVAFPAAYMHRMVTRRTESEELAPLLDAVRKSLARSTMPAPPGIAVAADMTGCSVRTLQRTLARNGLTYRRLVDRVRFDAALSLIEDPSMRLGDIAMALGYSEHAHFTRSFRRWTGVGPREYRELEVDRWHQMAR